MTVEVKQKKQVESWNNYVDKINPTASNLKIKKLGKQNALQQSESSIQKSSRKHFHINQNEFDLEKQQEKTGIKINPKRYETNIAIDENKYLIFVEQSKKKQGVFRRPSSQTQKQNDRQVFLPSEIRNRSNSNKGRKPISKTFQSQIFNSKTTSKICSYSVMSERVNRNKDNTVAALLKYSYALPFKSDQLTDKLNNRTIKEVNQITYRNALFGKTIE